MKELKTILLAANVFLLLACNSAARYEPCNNNDDICKTLDAKKCSGDNGSVLVCDKNKEGCQVWILSDDCNQQGWTCSDDGDEAKCVGECIDHCDAQDDTRCQGTLIQKCQRNSSDCLDWMDDSDCADNEQYCDDSGDKASCTSQCPDRCEIPGIARCDGDVIQTCTALDENCSSWVNADDCATTDSKCKQDMGTAWCLAPCSDNSECDSADYCKKSSCDDTSGTCEPKPNGCPEYYSPVCGCDGVTYGNDCEAAAAGQNIDYSGQCDATTCSTKDDCEKDFYCYKQMCDSEQGVCQQMPPMSECPRLWDPVCGCDGLTYSNDCEAQANGINIDHKDECESIGCWSNDMCDEGQYCMFDGCAAETGTCTARPLDCPDVWNPVCGCDGVTYPNDCAAAVAGVSVAHTGECNSEQCFGNDMCPPGQYCLLPGCGANSGTCTQRPADCPDVWEPVCGCDGVTYSNRCEAEMAGISIDYAGECSNLTCSTNSDCLQNNLYCKKAACDDDAGNCITRPKMSECPHTWEPVCACDNTTYPNSCVAAAYGQNIDHEGECGPAQSCSTSADCSEMDFCLLEVCDADTGTCRPMPPTCPDVWNPVCGCDGQTYSNRCDAAQNQQNVDYEGECN